jgi:hypothetical protein
MQTLKMGAIRTSETSVDTRCTRLHIPEDSMLHSYRCENLRSCNLNFLFLANCVPTHKLHAVAVNWMERVCRGAREMSHKLFVI